MTAAPHLTLIVVTSRDGYIGTDAHPSPQSWASEEEQALFFRDVEAADWSFMGRKTHEAADRPDRRRVIFSGSVDGWKRPSQLWLDPAGLTVSDLCERVAPVRPLRKGVILGGTRVHDWFLLQNAISRVHLTIEPQTFGGGVPVISDSDGDAPLEIFRARGFDVVEERQLNGNGTIYYVLDHIGLGAS